MIKYLRSNLSVNFFATPLPHSETHIYVLLLLLCVYVFISALIVTIRNFLSRRFRRLAIMNSTWVQRLLLNSFKHWISLLFHPTLMFRGNHLGRREKNYLTKVWSSILEVKRSAWLDTSPKKHSGLSFKSCFCKRKNPHCSEIVNKFVLYINL